MKDQEIITHRIEIENFLKEFDTRFDEGNIPLADEGDGRNPEGIESDRRSFAKRFHGGVSQGGHFLRPEM
jgi:hypothetical protein